MSERALLVAQSHLKSFVIISRIMSVLVLWVVTACGLVCRHHCFGERHCLHLQDASPDDEENVSLKFQQYSSLPPSAGIHRWN
jgi:hypothetical protein